MNWTSAFHGEPHPFVVSVTLLLFEGVQRERKQRRKKEKCLEQRKKEGLNCICKRHCYILKTTKNPHKASWVNHWKTIYLLKMKSLIVTLPVVSLVSDLLVNRDTQLVYYNTILHSHLSTSGSM